MKKITQLRIGSFFLITFVSSIFVVAQDLTTVSAKSNVISEHLDLEAVATVFGDSKDLEDFENRLNDPKTQISNLDLNEDNQVDYLRVVETSEKEMHLIAIQAVVGDNLYQDVATVEVEKDANGVTQVQLVGDVYLYGPEYIIEPVYVHRPVIFINFWKPFYRPYRSVYYWGFYPRHFHYWHPFKVHHYRKNVHVHVRHTYKRTTLRRSRWAARTHLKTRRTACVIRYPNKSYKARSGAVVKTGKGKKHKTVWVRNSKGAKKKLVPVKKAKKAKKSLAKNKVKKRKAKKAYKK